MGKMTMQWLGSGSGSNYKLGNASFIMKCGKRTLLVDCGPLAFIELVKKQLLMDITDIIITHAHSDHVNGLPALARFSYYTMGRTEKNKPILHLPNKYFAQNLWERRLAIELDTVGSHAKPIKVGLDEYFDLRFEMNIDIEGMLPIKMHKTKHVPGMECYGITFNHLIYYSGDSIDLPPDGYQYYFMDCASMPNLVHNCFDDYLDLDEDIRERIRLVHLDTDYDKLPIKKTGLRFVLPGRNSARYEFDY